MKTYNKTQLKVNDFANKLTVTYEDKTRRADERFKFMSTLPANMKSNFKL